MRKADAYEKALDALPTRSLRHLAREFGLNGTSRAGRATLKRALGRAPEFSPGAMLALLQPEDLARVGHAAGVRRVTPSRREVKARLIGVQRRPGESRRPRARIPKPEGYLLDATPVGGLFAGYRGAAAHRVYIGPDIPLGLLARAARRFSIPGFERIVVLYDNSLAGDAANGFAVGEHGIYWRNPFRIPSARNTLAWHELARAPMRRTGDFALSFGEDISLHVTFVDVEPLAGLVRKLQRFAREASYQRGMPLITPDPGAVAALCHRLNPSSFESFHIGEQVSGPLLARCRRLYRVPDYERVAAVCDDTVFGSCRRGFVLGAHGVYWRNDLGTWSARNALSWPELAMAHIRAADRELISLGEGLRIHAEFLSGEQGAAFFARLQRLVRDAAAEVAGHFGLDLDEQALLAQELGRTLRRRPALPVSVALAASPSTLQSLQATAVAQTARAADHALSRLGGTVAGILHATGIRRD